jgi:hypothetical protein
MAVLGQSAHPRDEPLTGVHQSQQPQVYTLDERKFRERVSMNSITFP